MAQFPVSNHVAKMKGSSTLIAAQQTGRKAFLMELDPLYCDVIVQRWEKFTGRKAERVGSNAVAEEKAATRVAAGSKA